VSVTTQPAAGLGAGRAIIVGLVAVLAIGIGVAAGAFLLTNTSGAAGTPAAYVPADALMYVELRLDASDDQDAAIREVLARFPAIEGVDLDRNLYDQMAEAIDEELANHEDVPLSWAEDVAPWFDGRIAFAVTDLPLDSLDDPMATPPMPGVLAVVAVSDPVAAREAADRFASEAATEGVTFTETEHRGVTIHAAGDEGAYAVTDDAVLLGPDSAAIEAALDTHAADDGRLGDTPDHVRLTERLPEDWLAYAVYDFSEIMAASFAAADGQTAAMADAFEALIEHQPMRGAMAVTAAGDRFAIDAVTAAPTGPFAVENADRGLAGEVPGDALYYAEGGSIGQGLAAMIEAIKLAAASEPEAEEQVATAEAALGADLEDLVSWVDDGALVAGWDGAEPYAGLLIVPNDVDAAERRLGQLATFAGLGALDPSSGLSVDEATIAGETVTTIRWDDPNGMSGVELPVPAGVVVQYTVTDDRAVIGLGEQFVGRVLELEAADSLASQSRFSGVIEALGGSSNAGVTWIDLAGTREAIVTALGPMIGLMDADGMYEAEIEPWLLPLDRYGAVTKLDGDLLVQRAALFFE
jgi:hypothetical protein